MGILSPKPGRRRKSSPSLLAGTGVFAAACMLATVAWLAGQVQILRRELAEVRSTRSPADPGEEAPSGEIQILAEAVRKNDLTQEQLSRHTAAIESLRSSVSNLSDDPAALVDRMVLPTVRLDMTESSGSGTVIHVRHPRGAGDGKETEDAWEVFILSASHVIEEVLGTDPAGTVTVEFFGRDGEVSRTAEADILRHDEGRDLAVLRVILDGDPPSCAVLAGRQALARVRTFQPVYTVGCPLGLAPLPSKGEITNTNRRIDGQPFWMTSAQMIFGNSGGGIFDARTQELVGVSSRVCAYGKVLPAAVPHLGVVVPMGTVLDWLESEKLEYLAARVEPVAAVPTDLKK